MARHSFTKELSNILTDEELVACTELLGGQRLHIPVTLETKAVALLALPESARIKIIKKFGGNQIQFPLNTRFMVGYYCRQGLNSNQIARKLRKSWCTVSTILNSSNLYANIRHDMGDPE